MLKYLKEGIKFHNTILLIVIYVDGRTCFEFINVESKAREECYQSSSALQKWVEGF